MSSLLHKGSRSDATLRCGEHTWNLHKLIVCERNDYFRAALDGKFAEGATGGLIWDDEEPFAVESLLMWLYTYQYPEPEDVEQYNTPSSVWEYHHEIWSIADRRQAPKLKEEARKRLCNAVREHWNVDDFISMVPTFWRSDCPDSLITQKAVLATALIHREELHSTYGLFQRLIEKEGKFSAGFVKALLEMVRVLNTSYSAKNERVAVLSEKLEAETARANRVTEIMERRDRRITELRNQIIAQKEEKRRK